MNSIKVSPSSLSRPRINRGRLKTPSPLPIRPLPIDRFRPPVGQKEVFLPNFVITFLHTPTRPANHASFLVPLWFSKLDLKDYLYHVYRVQCLRIRSYVMQAPVRQGKPGDRIPLPRQWFRPPSTKKMTVELVVTETETEVAAGQGPFVWPEEPTDWTPWAKEQFAEARKEQEEARERREEGRFGMAWPTDVESVGEKAGELLKRAGRAGDLVRVGWREELRKRREEEQKEEDERVRNRLEGVKGKGKDNVARK